MIVEAVIVLTADVRAGSLQTYKSEANGNIQTFVRLYAGTVYSILARIFSVYGYDPSVSLLLRI